MEITRNNYLRPVKCQDLSQYRSTGAGDYDSRIPTNEQEVPELVIHGDDFRIVLEGGCLAQVTRIGPKFYKYDHYHLGEGVAETISEAFKKIGFKVSTDSLGFYQLDLTKQRDQQDVDTIGLGYPAEHTSPCQGSSGSEGLPSSIGSRILPDRQDRQVPNQDCESSTEGPTQAQRIVGPVGA